MKWYEWSGANEPLYYLHLLIIVLITYSLLYLFKFGNMFSIKNIIVGIIFVGAADVLAHAILKLR